MLGASTQMGSMSWTGSISGLELEKSFEETSLQFASKLVELTGLEGVFGIDFIHNEEGLWPIDVNPRIPASAEVVGDHVLWEHMKSFGCSGGSLDQRELVSPSGHVQGKYVVFNTLPTPIRFELGKLAGCSFRHQSSSADESIADVPADGEVVKPRHPVLTIFASGEEVTEVENRLQEKCQETLHRLTAENH